MTEQRPITKHLGRLKNSGLLLGIVAAVACVALGYMENGQFFRSYLYAYLFWLTAGLAPTWRR